MIALMRLVCNIITLCSHFGNGRTSVFFHALCRPEQNVKNTGWLEVEEHAVGQAQHIFPPKAYGPIFAGDFPAHTMNQRAHKDKFVPL